MAGNLNTLEPGTQIDSYRIEAPVARSGMASIYRAVDMRNERVVALKIPNPDMETDPVLLERFRREAAIGEKLSHPGVMRVYDEVERSRVYMVMEWCDGESLQQILAAGRIAPDRALRIAIRALQALQYIHDNGVVHRALSPKRIMVDTADNVKLIDFGIAADATSRRLTFTNLTPQLGALYYISPEESQGKRGDSRSDIFSMGVILYEMMTGKLPFRGSSPIEVMNDRLLNPPTPPRVADPSVSPQLQEVMYRALGREPRNRYATAREFVNELEHLDMVAVENRPESRDWRKGKSHPPFRIAVYVALIMIPVALAIAMVLLSRHN